MVTMSQRIQKKVLQYSVLFKMLGVLNEEEYIKIAKAHKVKERH
jgi:preprotein translocase subunit Sss1